MWLERFFGSLKWSWLLAGAILIGLQSFSVFEEDWHYGVAYAAIWVGTALVAASVREVNEQAKLATLTVVTPEAVSARDNRVLNPKAFINPFQPGKLLSYMKSTGYPDNYRHQAGGFLRQAIAHGYGTNLYGELRSTVKHGGNLARIEAAKTLETYAEHHRSKERAIRSFLARRAEKDPVVRQALKQRSPSAKR